MSSPKYHQFMMNLRKCYEVVLQNTAKGGITANDIAKKMDMHKTVIHHLLNTLKAMKKVQDQHGNWFIRPKERTAETQEKEIVIELPIPKNEWQRIALLEDMARLFGGNDPTNSFKTALQALKETRTIRVKGKNVDDLDLERVGNLVGEANRSFSFNLKSLVKKLRVPKRQAPKSSET
jgi:hypothetical protein